MSSLVAYASDPTYEPRYSQGYEELTGYELTEDGVREALDNFDTLRLDGMWATIAVVGEQRYTTLTDRLKAIYAREPLERSDYADVPFDEFLRRPLFLDKFKTLVVRSLILCEDPDAGTLAMKEATRAGSGERWHAIKSLKYFLTTNSDFDVVKAFTTIIARDKNMKGIAQASIRELVEVEHYFRFSADPRRVKCGDALDKIQAGAPYSMRTKIETIRAQRPMWSATYNLYRHKHLMPEDYPILDAIVDYLLDR